MIVYEVILRGSMSLYDKSLQGDMVLWDNTVVYRQVNNTFQ